MAIGAMRGSHRVRVAVALVVAGVALAACSDSPAARPSAPTGPITIPSSPTALPLFTPAQFKELLMTLRGQPVVVNIWASWCGPCIAEAPGLARESRRFQGRVQFLGVDIIDHRPPARAFIRKYGWTYPSVFDPTGAIRDDLGFIGQPITIIYDASGNGTTWSGPIPEAELRARLEEALAE